MKQMRIAWGFIGRIKSNTIIVLDKDLPMTRGIGSGQTSRISGCYSTKSIQLSEEGITKKMNPTSANNIISPKDGELTTDDNNKIAYTFFENKDAKYGIVLLHMLDRDRRDWGSFAKLLQTAGYSAITIDLRGHGQSAMFPSRSFIWTNAWITTRPLLYNPVTASRKSPLAHLLSILGTRITKSFL